MNKTILARFTLSALALALAACGGSSSSNNNGNNGNGSGNGNGSTGPNLTWVANQFDNSNTYKNYCATPRSGSDPYTGEVYQDKEGSTLHEQMWLRSWSNETYLWYDEINDVNPAGYASAVDYFNILRTEQTTDSGVFKDNFHFSQNTLEYNERTVGGTSSGYGIRWAFARNTPPRNLFVLYTEPNSPAEIAGLMRGDTILEVDGEDLVEGNNVDVLNAGLFPATDGESHTLKVRTALGDEKTLTLTSAQVEVEPVHNAKVIEFQGKKIGYMQFNTFIAKAQTGLSDAINLFNASNVDEAVIDLRYNGGGLLALAAQLGYMVAGDMNTQSRTFYQTLANDKYAPSAPTPFYDKVIDYDLGRLTDTDLPTASLNRIYVLTTSSSCSASEALINGLRGIDIDVVMIGDTTCGKPYGFTPTDNCGTTYFTIQFTGVNAKGFGEYADGLKPTASPQYDDEVKGCQISDDFTRPLGDISEGLLSGALYHMNTGQCPSAKQSINYVQAAPKLNKYSLDRKDVILDSIMQEAQLNNQIKLMRNEQ